jgi:hypothetical protein
MRVNDEHVHALESVMPFTPTSMSSAFGSLAAPMHFE